MKLVLSQALREDTRKVIYADKHEALILFMKSVEKPKVTVKTELTGLIYRRYYQPAIKEDEYIVENIEELKLQAEAIELGLKLKKLISGKYADRCGFTVDKFREFYDKLWESRVFDTTLETWSIAHLVDSNITNSLEMRQLLDKNNIEVVYPEVLDPKAPYFKTVIWGSGYTRRAEAPLLAPVNLAFSDKEFEYRGKLRTKPSGNKAVSHRIFQVDIEDDIKDMIIKLAIKTQAKYKKARIEYLTNYFRAKGLLDE